jgi:hypothetical protein
MNNIKARLKQPSTWLGILKIAAAIFGFHTGHVDTIGAAVLSIFGTADVVRDERI